MTPSGSGALVALINALFSLLGMSLLEYVNLQLGRILDMNAVTWVVTYLLTGLDYLHTNRVVHAGISSNLSFLDSPTVLLQTPRLTIS